MSGGQFLSHCDEPQAIQLQRRQGSGEKAQRQTAQGNRNQGGGKAMDQGEEMSKPGYIYVITGEGYAKIGITERNPKHGRLQGLQHTCPFDLSIFVARRVAHVRREEMRLHRRYQEWRARGEWFRLGAQQLVEIHHHILSLAEVPSVRYEKPRKAKKYRPSAWDSNIGNIGVTSLSTHYRNNTGPFAPEELAKQV